jgi:uncharacterized protein YllA (UPF0747 family)
MQVFAGGNRCDVRMHDSLLPTSESQAAPPGPSLWQELKELAFELTKGAGSCCAPLVRPRSDAYSALQRTVRNA